MEYDTILIRYGELALKAAGTRRRFEDRLVLNLKDAMQRLGAEGEVAREWGRIFIDGGDDKAVEAARRTFGVVSLSTAKRFDFKTLDDIKKVAADYAVPRMKKGESFGIRARRSGSHNFTSMDAAREAGAAVVDATGAKVNLTKPDREFFLEIRDNKAYFFVDKIEGPGGLPLGIEGKVLCLISGGIDSPVAAYLMMKRGCEVDFVHFSMQPFMDRRSSERVEAVLHALSKWTNGYRPKVFYVPHGPTLEAFMSSSASSQMCVMCKRMLLRVSERVAAKDHCSALVTGDSLGQVASQTLDNIVVESAAVRIPVFRPLIGLDKLEIEAIAKRIGTYDESTKPAGCCTATPRHPETEARIEVIDEEENFADVNSLAEAEFNNMEEVDLV